MKKVIGLVVIALALALMMVWALAETPVFEEREPNDTRDTAEALCMNAVIKGELTPGKNNDFDCYRLIVPETGEITVHFEHAYVDTSNTVCYLQLYPVQSGQRIWYKEQNGKSANVDYYTFYLGEGEYDFIVESRYRDVLPYQMTVAYAAQPKGESEANNTPETANPISANEFYYGAITYDNDVDYYRLTVPEKGATQFIFRHEYIDSTYTYYKINITRGIGGQTVRSLSFTGKDTEWTSYPFYISAGDYYIRIENGSRTNCPYTFLMGFTADPDVEEENNSDFKSATEVEVNKPFTGSFSMEKDVDMYRFVLTQPGSVVLHHEHEYFDNGNTYYNLTMYDAPRSDSALFTSGLTARDSDWTRYAIYLPAGEYYLQYSMNSWTARPYTFTLRFTPMDNIEIERNNSYSTATFIQPNKDYSGALMTDKDSDYYTFELNETSKVQVFFNFTYFDNTNNYFKLALDTDAKNNVTYYSANLNGRDSDYSSNPFYLAAGTYYFRVEKSSHTFRPYTLRIAAEPCPDAELEWNNNYGAATPIALGQMMNGALRYDGDIDYYVLTVVNPTTVQLKFSHTWFDNGNNYYQVAFDAQPNTSRRLFKMDIKGRDGDRTSDPVTLQPGTYYISVNKSSYTSRPYVLTIEPSL